MASTITICSPVAFGAAEARPLAPRRATLRGCTLGLRLDPTWRSWTIVAGALDRIARDDWGVRDVVAFAPGMRLGSPEQETARIAAFAGAVDVAIVGLGT